jgi:hypothetical protein
VADQIPFSSIPLSDTLTDLITFSVVDVITHLVALRHLSTFIFIFPFCIILGLFVTFGQVFLSYCTLL